MIERHCAYHVGPASERNDADAVVWPRLDEIAGDLANGVDAGGRLSADFEILRQHRGRYVQGEHDIDPARLDLREALAPVADAPDRLRRKPGLDQHQRAKDFPSSRRARFSRGPGDWRSTNTSTPPRARSCLATTRAAVSPHEQQQPRVRERQRAIRGNQSGSLSYQTTRFRPLCLAPTVILSGAQRNRRIPMNSLQVEPRDSSSSAGMT